eukprot:CAMPEP_0115352416 /NCGR_PEP_ID=MMETSP0270-20121206/97490_1 /TAXON_ID=71861 /ORGANISM="Scrippsiella trochoidea, Strain CCMP3099" /LENGTH=41 /DNA_ID= /DNA_START= /DNA_END= /DNA_ORIENTATION=
MGPTGGYPPKRPEGVAATTLNCLLANLPRCIAWILMAASSS